MTGFPSGWLAEMAVLVETHKPVTVDPLRHSAPVGAVLAFLGVAGCIPLLHSSQGCAAMAKTLLTRHFRESIPLQTSALTEVTTILGSGDSLLEGIATVADRLQPAIIGVITTGLVDAAGEDVCGTLRLRSLGLTETTGITETNGITETARSTGTAGTAGTAGTVGTAGPGMPPVVLAAVPDLGGGLEQGYAAAVEAIISELVFPRVGKARDDQVAVLPGPSLSPLDVEELRETAEAFGLRTIMLPDSSRSLDGHLDADWEPLLRGGTPVSAIADAGQSAAVLCVGAGLESAGRMLAGRMLAGTDAWVVPHAVGLDASDALVMQLAAVAGRQVPEGLRHWRSRLTDGLMDASGMLAGRRVALALEPDLLAGVAALLTEAGCRVVSAVTTASYGAVDHLLRLPCDEVVVGDFEDAEERARDGGAELLVASSHGAATAQRLGIPLLRLGFPVVDRLGAQHLTSVGYRGSLRLLFAAANELIAVPDPSPTRPTTTTTLGERPC
jgi:nitrogenase molybdenum-iron protein NifN